MKIDKKDLELELKEMLSKASQAAKVFNNLDLESLNRKPSEEGWSILECIEHLCRYGRFYVPEIQSRINQSKYKPDTIFKSGFLGNYFAESMRSKPKLNKMNTFKNMNPKGSSIKKEVISEFEDQTKNLDSIVNQFSDINMTKVKTGITISNWIKLRLGDTMRVVIYHIDRHIDQANRLL